MQKLIVASASALLFSFALTCPAAPPQYKVLTKFSIGGEGGWDYLTVDSGMHRLYISRGTHVQVMDTDSGKLIGDIANTNGVHGIAIAPRLHKGFTSNGRDNSVTVFDTRSLKELAKVKVGRGPDAIIFDSGTSRVFTLNGGGGDATAIDAKTNDVVGTVKLDGRPEFAAADGKGRVFVNIEDKSEIQEVNSKSLQPVRTWSLAPGDGPSGIGIDAKHHYLFSTCGNNLLVVSDTQKGAVVATPRIGNGPDAGGFDPGLGLAFSSNGEGNLTIVKETSHGVFEAVQTVETQPSARTMALDPRTHRIYLIAAKYQAAAPGDNPRRRRLLPGSTVIVVVGPG